MKGCHIDFGAEPPHFGITRTRHCRERSLCRMKDAEAGDLRVDGDPV